MKLIDLLRRKNVRKFIYVILLLVIWEAVALSGIYPSLLFPDLKAVATAFIESIQSGEMFTRTYFSLYLIGLGMLIGTVLGLIVTVLSMISPITADFAELSVSIFDPLPGIALLPIALLWFGTGSASIIFVIVHSVIWPFILNTYTGFRSVSKTQLEVGRNIGLKGTSLVWNVMIPSAFPYILTGLKIAWARSWRALVAAEMIFGASGNEGGLGWLIYQRRYFLDIPGVFAALVMIIIIGILVEGLLFAQVEKRTIQRWGMVVARS